MKRKIILLLLIIISLSGCSINYDLNIEDDKIVELTTMTQQEDNNFSSNYIMSSYNSEYPIFIDEEFLYYAPTEKIDGNTYYEKSINENNGLYTARYKANYDFNNYSKSRFLDTAYKHYAIGYDNNEKTYYIMANDLKIFSYNKNIDNITVSINLNNYEVIESNHQRKNNNKYIWSFDKNNPGTINIKFRKISSSNQATNPNSQPQPINDNTNKHDYTMYILSGILLIIFLIGYSIYKKITGKDDSID